MTLNQAVVIAENDDDDLRGGPRRAVASRRRVATETARVAAQRARWAQTEAARDEAWLRWIGRFRFVTADALAAQFAVSRRRASARLERLEAAQLVYRLAASDRTAPRVVCLTRGATDALELPPRRLPRHVDRIALRHELAIIECVRELEHQAAVRALPTR